MAHTATVEELRASLRSLADTTDDKWFSGLDPRKRAELEFHDKHRDPKTTAEATADEYQKRYANKKYYLETASHSDRYAFEWMQREARGRVFLDYACGNGGNCIFAAKSGAELSVGIDLSPVSVANARRRAEESGVADRTWFAQTDAEDTKLPSNAIDRVICHGVLHHLDRSKAFPELHRIMKPGGKLLAVEALNYNPAIKLYRKLTPAMRTEWETAHILSLKDLRAARTWFDLGEVKYWHIAGILAPHARPVAPALHALDAVLTKIPGIQLMAWIFTFELIKR